MISSQSSSPLISLLLKKIHFHFYAIDGRGLVPLHVTAMIFEVASYFFIVILLILIACGWTLIYLVFTEMEIYMTISTFILLYHGIIAGLTQVTANSYWKFDDYDGIQGLLLAVGRLLLFLYFIYCLRDTKKTHHLNIRNFLTLFGTFSGLYILAFPILWVVSRVLPFTIRHKIMVFGNLGIQLCAFCVLLNMFKQSSTYNKVAQRYKPVLFGPKNE